MNERNFAEQYKNLPIFYTFLQEVPIEVVSGLLIENDWQIIYAEEMKEYNSKSSLCFLSNKPVSKLSNNAKKRF